MKQLNFNSWLLLQESKNWMIGGLMILLLGVFQCNFAYCQSNSAKTLISGRYLDNGDGTVTDMQTYLQWMRCPVGEKWNSYTCAGKAGEYSWQAALDLAKALNNQGGYAGHQDWRVPNCGELLSLVYCSSGRPMMWNNTGSSCKENYSRPTIDTTAFPNMPAWLFWSTDKFRHNFADGSGVDSACAVSYEMGYESGNSRSAAYHVRLVRAGQ